MTSVYYKKEKNILMFYVLVAYVKTKKNICSKHKQFLLLNIKNVYKSLNKSHNGLSSSKL